MSRKNIFLLLGPFLGLAVYFIFPETGTIAKVAAIGTWMATWWITEAVKIYFTALLPLFLFPLFGVLPMTEVAPLFTKDIIFLFVGGFFIAFGMERWNLHKRIALRLILAVGATPSRILFGFMLASYLLSMWIMNTATVTMMLPAVLAVVQQIEENGNGGNGGSRLATPFLLGLAYASSIGGMATLIGTAPNLIFMDFFNERYAEPQINFANWFAMAAPLSVVLFAVCYMLLRYTYRKSFKEEEISLQYCESQYAALGKMGYEEKVVSVVFSITVLLWFFMKDINFGSVTMPGWSRLLPEASFVKESTVAMLMAGVLYLYPAKSEKGGIIRWEEIQRLPLGIIFLFGGGFALAKGFEVSGLSEWLAGRMQELGKLPPFVMVLLLCLFMTFLTELTSNTASTLLVLPIIFSFVAGLSAKPIQIFIPVVLSASCAFMLPVATPPNTIVFSSERLLTQDMARTGIWLNFVAATLIAVAAFSLVSWAY